MKYLKMFFIPILGLIAAIICTIVQYFIADYEVSFAITIIGGGLLLFLYPLAGIIFRTKLPRLLGYAYYIHVILAMFLGTAYNFYALIPWFDIFLHGVFGIEACFIAYLILIKNKCVRLINMPVFLIFILMFAMGCGAIWEIYEFLYDILTGSDSQHVHDSLNPVSDTMGDIIITLVGVLVTYVGIFIDKAFGFKAMKTIYLDFGGELEEQKNNN